MKPNAWALSTPVNMTGLCVAGCQGRSDYVTCTSGQFHPGLIVSAADILLMTQAGELTSLSRAIE